MSQKFLTHFQIEIPSPRKQKQNNFPWDAAYEFSIACCPLIKAATIMLITNTTH